MLDLTALAKSEEAKFTAAEVNVPEEIKAFVSHAHDFWAKSPKVWRRVELGTDEAVIEAAKLARKFAASTGRTFRIKRTDEAGTMIYKVTDAVAKNTENGTGNVGS